MPEGDTIFRTAQTLARALVGRTVTSFESPLVALSRVDIDHPIAGRTIQSVRSVGKHLLIEFSGNLVLRTHLRMNGSWHIYRPGERWRRPRMSMRIVLATDEYVAVGFDVPVAEFIDSRKLERHQELSRLGPDLLSDDFRESEVVARLRQSKANVADALLDQRVMAGVGNVFKSEVLFICGINPFTGASTLTEDEARLVVRRARELLRVNVLPPSAFSAAHGYRKTTRSMNPEARLWVYGRGGRACRKCGATIQSVKQGESARLTYWCPVCQRSSA